jgi:hypothetical protein
MKGAPYWAKNFPPSQQLGQYDPAGRSKGDVARETSPSHSHNRVSRQRSIGIYLGIRPSSRTASPAVGQASPGVACSRSLDERVAIAGEADR